MRSKRGRHPLPFGAGGRAGNSGFRDLTEREAPDYDLTVGSLTFPGLNKYYLGVADKLGIS